MLEIEKTPEEIQREKDFQEGRRLQNALSKADALHEGIELLHSIGKLDTDNALLTKYIELLKTL